jgi:hypothetical protein
MKVAEVTVFPDTSRNGELFVNVLFEDGSQSAAKSLVEFAQAAQDAQDALVIADNTTNALSDALNAKDAEITEYRGGLSRLQNTVNEMMSALAAARDAVTGIEHPRKIEDLPSLNDLKPHQSLDVGQPPALTVDCTADVSSQPEQP